jgi:hypothetical protein
MATAVQDLEATMDGPIGRSFRSRDLVTARRVLLGADQTASRRTGLLLTAGEAARFDLKAEAARHWERRREVMAQRLSNWAGLAMLFKEHAIVLMLADRHFNT